MSDKFPSAEILRRLGISSPELYSVGRQPMVPTMQLLDFSRSIATEPVEARGYKDALAPLVGGSFAICGLQARSPGGCLIEAFVVEDPLPGGYFGPNNVSFSLLPQMPAAWLPTVLDTPGLGIGGVAIRSTAFIAYTLTDRDPALANWEVTNNPTLQGNLRCFLPSGSVFAVQNHLVSGALQIAFVWRELAEGHP